MTALGERMTQDMIVRGLSPNTQAAYLRAVTQLARFYRRSPERILEREITASCSTSPRAGAQPQHL